MSKEIKDPIKEARKKFSFKFWYILMRVRLKIADRLYKLSDWLAKN